MFPIKLKQRQCQEEQQGLIQEDDEQYPVKNLTKLEEAEGFGCGKMGYGPDKYEFQDSYHYYQLNCDSYFYAICDGHGKQGKEAAQATNDYIQTFLEKELRYLQNRYDIKKIEKLLEGAISYAESQLKSSGIDYSEAGTCIICVLIILNQCYIANIGNSRAVVYQETDKENIAFELSSDHRPTRADERQRILKHNGIIEQYKFEEKHYGPERIWRNADGPGFTTTRALGNLNAKAIGVISSPEIFTHQLNIEDKFIVLGSDGLWDVMSSEEVCEFIRKSEQQNVYELIEECRGRWYQIEQKSESKFLVGDSITNICDDISVIIVYLKYKQQ